MTGRGVQFRAVSSQTGGGRWFCCPTGGFFGVVAGFTESLAVGEAGGSAVVPRDDVVVVADRGVAVRRAAGVIPGLDEAAQPRGEEPGPGIHRDQVTAPRSGVEPAQPGIDGGIPGGSTGEASVMGSGGSAGSDVPDDGPRPACRDHTVTGEPGRFGIALKERAVGHYELDLDPRDPPGGAGGPFDQGVGHDLAPGTFIPVGAEGGRVAVERGVHGHTGRDGQ